MGIALAIGVNCNGEQDPDPYEEAFGGLKQTMRIVDCEDSSDMLYSGYHYGRSRVMCDGENPECDKENLRLSTRGAYPWIITIDSIWLEHLRDGWVNGAITYRYYDELWYRATAIVSEWNAPHDTIEITFKEMLSLNSPKNHVVSLVLPGISNGNKANSWGGNSLEYDYYNNIINVYDTHYPTEGDLAPTRPDLINYIHKEVAGRENNPRFGVLNWATLAFKRDGREIGLCVGLKMNARAVDLSGDTITIPILEARN
jgi:hypothetical protein